MDHPVVAATRELADAEVGIMRLPSREE